MSTILSLGDVLDYFGFDHDPNDDLETLNRRLSRRVYKNTECGAWAFVEGPGQRVVGHRDETWSCQYYLVDHVWTRGNICREDGTPEVSPPSVVVEFFWPDPEMVAAYLRDTYPGQVDITLTTLIRVPRHASHDGVFWCGSIVEGTDADVVAAPVYLPCQDEELDAAIQYVEREARSIWDQTHGCESCGLDGAINPDCPVCGGEGTII